MAKQRDATTLWLQISLILFVVLTFILAVTTYIFFGMKLEAEEALAEAEKRANEQQAQANDGNAAAERLRTLLGFPESKPVDEIETEANTLFAETYGDFQVEPKTYVRLAEQLLEAVRARDGDLLAKDEQIAVAEAKVVKSEAAVQEAQQKAAEKVAAIEGQLQEAKRDFDQRRQKFEQQQQQLVSGQESAQQESTQYKALLDELTKGSRYLPGDVRERYTGERSGPIQQIGMLYDELRGQTKEIERLNKVVAGLGGTRREVQDFVLRSLPQAEQVDRFDGRIVSIDEVNRTVQIAVASTLGLQPGLIFRVFSGGSESPAWAASKGVVEVVGREDARFVTARIRSESIGNPILVGDTVATPLWKPGIPLDVVVVGLVRLDNDDREDSDRLTKLIERIGGRVVENVNASVTMLIDAGKPVTTGREGSGPVFRERDARRRGKALEEADRLGVRTMGLDAFLEWLGIDRQTANEGEALDIPESRRSREDY